MDEALNRDPRYFSMLDTMTLQHLLKSHVFNRDPSKNCQSLHDSGVVVIDVNICVASTRTHGASQHEELNSRKL